MDDDKIKVVSTGVSFDGLLIILGVIFCILRGAGVIDWSWVLCTIPFMIIAGEIGLVLVVLIICLVIAGIMALIDKHRRF